MFCGRKLWAKVAVAILPLLLVFLHVWLWPGEIDVLNWGEPDFGYLLNSADLRFGLTPAHTDHPGIPVQMLGVVVFGFSQLLHWGDSSFSWYNDLLLHPAKYQLFTSWVLLACSLAGLWALGASLVRCGHSVALALFLQGFVFLSLDFWLYLPRLSPEKLLVFTGSALTALVLTQDKECRSRASFPLALGLILGFSLATKYNSVGLIPFLLLVPGIRGKLVAFAASVLFFFCFTIPMWGDYGRSFGWVSSIFWHQGIYGTGPEGVVPGFSTLRENLALLWGGDKYFLLISLLLVLAAFIHPRARKSRDSQVAILSLLVTFLLVWKHPASRYLLPWISPLAIVAFHLFQTATRIVLALGGLVLILVGFNNAVHAKSSISSLRSNVVQLRLLDKFRQQHPDCVWVYGNPVPNAESALAAANGSAGLRHTPALVKLFPGAYFFESNSPHFHRFASWISLKEMERELRAKGCLYIGGTYHDFARESLESQKLFRYKIQLLNSSPDGPYVLRVDELGKE